jgi:hypothetical protein
MIHLLSALRRHSSILEKVFTLLKQQQRMGKIKKIFEQHSSTGKLEACRQELGYTPEMFKVHVLQFISLHI